MITRLLQFLFGKTLYVTLSNGCYSKVTGVRKQVVVRRELYRIDPKATDKMLVEKRDRVRFFGIFNVDKGGFWVDEVVRIGPEFPRKEESA